MAIHTYWDQINPAIIHMDLVDSWTWADYHEANKVVVVMAKTVDHRVDQILDMRQSAPIPRENARDNIKAARQIHQENMCITVIVGSDETIEALVEFMTYLYGNRYHPRFLANSLDEAYTIIQRHYAGEIR